MLCKKKLQKVFASWKKQILTRKLILIFTVYVIFTEGLFQEDNTQN